MTYTRKCPKCNKDIIYEDLRGYNDGIRYNRSCSRSCAATRKTIRQEFYKKCPSCTNEMIFYSKRSLEVAILNNTACSKSCGELKKTRKIISLKRNCPVCGDEIIYHSQHLFDKANKNNSSCSLSCAGKKKNHNQVFKRNCHKCNDEIFYKTKSDFNKATKSNQACSRKCSKNNYSHVELKRNCPVCNNEIIYPTYGKYNNALLKNSTCSKSCIKELSKTSHFGYNGYYKNYHFRSLLELSYLIYLVENNIEFESAESGKHSINYTFKNKNRRYYPDFYLKESSEYIEIKPSSLINSDLNKIKFKSARKKLNSKFKIITEKKLKFLDLNFVYNLHLNGDIVLGKYSLIRIYKRLKKAY